MNKTAGTQTLKAMHVQSVKGGLVHVDYFHPADPLAKGGHFPRCRTGGQNSRGTIYCQTNLAVTCSKCLTYIARHEAAGSSFYPAPPADAEPVTVVTATPTPAADPQEDTIPTPTPATAPEPVTEEAPVPAALMPGRPFTVKELAGGPVNGGAPVQVARGLALAAAQLRKELEAYGGAVPAIALQHLARVLEDQALMSAAMEPAPATQADKFRERPADFYTGRGTPGWNGTSGPHRGQYGRPHAYARQHTRNDGRCVCGEPFISALHIQAAPGVPMPANRDALLDAAAQS